MGRTRFTPPNYGGKRREPETIKKQGWQEQGLFAVDLDDRRLGWPERKLIEDIGNRLYGERKEQNSNAST